MSENRFSAMSRFLSFVVEAFWYLIRILILLTVALWLSVMLGWKSGNLIFSLPVKLEYQASLDSFSSQAGQRISHFKVVGNPLVSADNLSKSEISLFICSVMLPALVIVLLIVRQLRLFLRSVKAGRPFERDNPARIRRIGYLVTVLGPLVGLGNYISGSKFIQRISLPDFSISVETNIHLEMVFTGLLIVLIAQIFEVGVSLQEDQDLTV
jgi:hypothetical protein